MLVASFIPAVQWTQPWAADVNNVVDNGAVWVRRILSTGFPTCSTVQGGTRRLCPLKQKFFNMRFLLGSLFAVLFESVHLIVHAYSHP
jgi:hypothetical protein